MRILGYESDSQTDYQTDFQTQESRRYAVSDSPTDFYRIAHARAYAHDNLYILLSECLKNEVSS